MSKLKKIYIFFEKRNTIELIRPLLCLNRFEIFKLVKFWHLPIQLDYTNKIKEFRRNKLRKQFLPLLRLCFNPKIDSVLNHLIEIVNNEKMYFDNIIRKNLNFYHLSKYKNLKKFKSINYLPISFQRRLYKIYILINGKSLNFEEIEGLLNFMLIKNK